MSGEPQKALPGAHEPQKALPGANRLILPASVRGVLLDIEGTTSSVRFVYDVMFPFVRRELAEFLRQKWQTPAVRAAAERIAADAGRTSLAAWLASEEPERDPIAIQREIDEGTETARNLVMREVIRLMDGDVKATGLKELQGLIWEAGFLSGEMRAHLYDEVPSSLAAWHAAGIDLRIYSSGSVAAQKLFFGHTIAGNLLPLFRGHYDTTIGGKKEAKSYTAIAAAFGRPASEIVFFSDIPAECAAAREAGMRTALVRRPENAPVTPDHGFSEISSFAEVSWGAAP